MSSKTSIESLVWGESAMRTAASGLSVASVGRHLVVFILTYLFFYGENTGKRNRDVFDEAVGGYLVYDG
jgi:hypothetical protein